MANQDQSVSMQDMMRLIQSPAGQQLMKILQSSDDPSLRLAMDEASGGHMDAAKEALQHLAANEEIKKLLKQLGG